MAEENPAGALTQQVLTRTLTTETVILRQLQIQREVLAHSRHLRTANFAKIHTADLAFLFAAYDRLFFDNLCRPALQGCKLEFRMAPRMIKTAGTTTKFILRKTGEIWYEIAIGISLLFDAFREEDRTVTAVGLECNTRLDALQRVFEHELVHLVENLCWDETNCSQSRFQDIARRFFGHQGHTHALITPHERAHQSGIRVGARVQFNFEGQRLNGVVNQITKRATVLVEDPAGMKYSDGRHYKKYYVPLRALQLVAANVAGV